ncbi:hypothetical protein Tco_1032584 [Tanacetum coccineum]|uniref:Uncharacterized protein n=1 Tax=Tanacetum coccineum TaxID=301880 RepID=A0ABQ5GDZ2_9ASTR
MFMHHPAENIRFSSSLLQYNQHILSDDPPRVVMQSPRGSYKVPPLAVLPKAARNSIPDLVSRPGEYTTALVRSGKPYLRHLILHEQEWYRRRGYLRSGNEYGRESDGGRSKVCGPGLLNKQQLQGSAGAKCSSTPLHHQSSSSSDHVQMAHHHPLSSPLSAGIVAGSTSRILPRSSSSDSSAGRLRIYPGDSV